METAPILMVAIRPLMSKLTRLGKKTPQNPQNPQNPPVRLTVIQNDKGLATKVFRLSAEGSLLKTSAAQVYEGNAREVSVSDLEELLAVITELKANEALCFGIMGRAKARLVSQKSLAADPHAVARDRAHFSFAEGQPGILMLDYDPRTGPGHSAMTWEELDNQIAAIIPAWDQTARMWRPSASSFIYRGDGAERSEKVAGAATSLSTTHRPFQRWELTSIKDPGPRGSDTFRSLLPAACWIAASWTLPCGSPNGSILRPAVLEGDLIRKASEAVILPGAAILRSATCTAELTVSEWRRKSPDIERKRQNERPKADQVRRKYISQRVANAKTQGVGLTDRRYREVLASAIVHQVLPADFPLRAADGAIVYVRDLLVDPEKWDGERFADPLEPDYRSDTRIAFAGPLGSEPFVYSHAHGGCSYRLVSEVADIVVSKGEAPRVVDEALAVMRNRGDMFERGGELVRLRGDGVSPVADIYLADYLGRHVRFLGERRSRGEPVLERIDVPARICAQIIAKSGERGLSELVAVITAPTLRPDGTVLRQPGLDEETGLLLKGDGFCEVKDNPTLTDLKGAFSTLWKPFTDFPYVSPVDRGVVLAAILTALVRRSLPQSPAFSLDAPSAGTGKTLLGQCILRLSGSLPVVVPQCAEEDELRKRLLSTLREGGSGVLSTISEAFSAAPPSRRSSRAKRTATASWAAPTCWRSRPTSWC